MRFTNKPHLFQVFFLAVIMSIICVSPRAILATDSIQPLIVGSYWSGSGTIHRTLHGTGNYAGNWAADTKYVNKFTVVKYDIYAITVLVEYTGSWSNTATGTWIERNGGESTQGTVTPVRFDETIDRTTMKITAVSNNAYKRLVGVLALLLIEPQNVHEEGTVVRDRFGSALNWTVGVSQTVNIEDAKVDVWPVSRTGDWYGSWHVGDNYSTGKETITYFYDKTYGIGVGWARTGIFSYSSEEGGWSEALSDSFQVSDSNMFSQPSVFRLLRQPHILDITLAIIVIVVVAVMLMIRKRRIGPVTVLNFQFCKPCLL